jgi:uncharacterized membrane protein
MPSLVSSRSRRSRRVGRALLVLSTATVLSAFAVAPVADAAGGVNVTTPYPDVVVKPGGTASFTLNITVDSAREVQLAANGAPDGWRTTFRGGGNEIDGVFANGRTAPQVTLDVVVPDGAQQGTARIGVVARAGAGSATLPITVRVATEAGGTATLTAQFPELQGSTTDTYTFNVDLKNGTASDITFAIGATGPSGWTVTAKPSGSDRATSVPVKAGQTSSISVDATAPPDAEANTYPIQLTATGGGQDLKTDLKVTIKGTFKMTLSTPDQNLNVRATSGSAKDVQFRVTNDGTAPLTNVTLSATPPTGWKLDFPKEPIPGIEAGKFQDVTGTLTPSGDAIAGDYNVNVTAKAAEANSSATIRATIETSQLFGLVGIALIVLVLAGLYWVFRTYGRR